MSAKRKPQPWTWTRYENNSGIGAKVKTSRLLNAVILAPSPFKRTGREHLDAIEEAEAAARLIAESPTRDRLLKEALEDLCSINEQLHGPMAVPTLLIQEIQESIRRVEGDTNQ